MKNILKLINEEINDFVFLNETYQSINELLKLSNDIILKVAEKTYNYYSNKEIKPINYMLSNIKLSEINSNNYFSLKTFIEKNYISIIFIPVEGKTNTRGRFIPSNILSTIEIYYDKNQFKYHITNNNVISKSTIYYALRTSFSPNTLAHELQHAYLFFLTKGKNYKMKTNAEYYKLRNNDDNIYKDNFNYNNYNQYLNTEEELWAKFAQTFDNEELFHYINFPNKIIPLNVSLNKFKEKYPHFKELTKENQFRMIRKFVQFWHLEQEKMFGEK